VRRDEERRVHHLDGGGVICDHIPGIDLECAVVGHEDVGVALHNKGFDVKETDTVGSSALRAEQRERERE
jgi:hypothetical protein